MPLQVINLCAYIQMKNLFQLCLQGFSTVTWSLRVWRVSPALTSPSATWAYRRTSLSTCRSDKPGWRSVCTDTLSSVIHLCMKRLWNLTPSLFCSDHPGYCGGHHHPAPHLPQEEASNCHRPYQRGQQVSLNHSRGKDRQLVLVKATNSTFKQS